MSKEEIISYIKNIDLSVYKHGSNIIAKHNNWDKLTQIQKKAFPLLVEKYYIFLSENEKLKGHSDTVIQKRTKLLNDYYDFINVNNYDNVFTSQGKFRPTILEEFMYILFRDLVVETKIKINKGQNDLKIGSATAYTNLFFSGANFESFIDSPSIGINQKDQDFAIYRPIEIIIGASNTIKTNLPIVAI